MSKMPLVKKTQVAERKVASTNKIVVTTIEFAKTCL
jgi:hypothetical protein